MCQRPATLFKKRRLAQIFYSKFHKFLKKTFLYRIPPVAASAVSPNILTENKVSSKTDFFDHGTIIREGITCKKILLLKSIEFGIPLK